MVSKDETSSFAPFLNDSKFFAIDVIPGMVPCDGDLVHLLKEANVGRYIDFKLLEATYVYLPTLERFEKVPATKEDVFQNKSLSLIEKRKVMKCLTMIQTMDEEQLSMSLHQETPFADFLQKWLPDAWIDVMLYACAGATSSQEQMTTEQGARRVRQMFQSMSIYGPSAYLLPMYGVSEIAQAFCRVSAIYGATYRLAHDVTSDSHTDSSTYPVASDNHTNSHAPIYAIPSVTSAL